MSTDLDIFSGPAQITLYDATNGYLHLGWCEAQIKEKPKKVKNIENQTLLIEKNFDFNAKVIQFNENILNNLAARNTIKQNIYLLGFDSMVTINDIFLSYFIERPFSSKPHRLTIIGSGSTNLVAHQVNLLYPDGKFENDTDGDGLADNWIKSGDVNSVEIRSSFLSNGGNAQYFKFTNDGNDQNIQYRIIAPCSGIRKISASVYVKCDPDIVDGPGDVCLGIYTRDVNNNWIENKYEQFHFDSTQEKRISITHKFNLNTMAKELIFIIHNKGGTLKFTGLMDNAQLEIGKLSNFKEY